jgi:RNA polymerase sigma-70 factor (ECF subfamily)
MEDAELVRQVLEGDTEAYAELVNRWAARITALCHSQVRRGDVADDLAQETLLRGFESLPTLTDPERFGPWLASIALNTCRDWLKARQNSQVPISSLPGGQLDQSQARHPGGRSLSVAAPGEEAEQQDELTRLMNAVEELPEEYRTALMLYYYEDVTYRELAEMLGVSTATINARLTRARMMLRANLGVLSGQHSAPPALHGPVLPAEPDMGADPR